MRTASIPFPPLQHRIVNHQKHNASTTKMIALQWPYRDSFTVALSITAVATDAAHRQRCAQEDYKSETLYSLHLTGNEQV
jgi:hypothetical protein